MADKTAQAAFGAQPPDPELKRLEPLLGTWTSKDHTQDSVYGPGVPVTATETFRWLDGGYFLVQEYETTFGEEPTQRGVNYWATTPRPAGSGSSSSATTDRSPRTATATRARWPTAGSPSSVRRASSTSSMRKGRSRRTRTARSPWPGGCATSRASGSPGWSTPSGRTATSPQRRWTGRTALIRPRYGG
jgi:hypothetical protein